MNLPQLIKPKRYGDGRGWFSETFRETWLGGTELAPCLDQENPSRTKKAGTLRAMHLQIPPAPQAKLITVLQGRILDVAVDLRRNSPTYAKFVSKELSAESGLQ